MKPTKQQIEKTIKDLKQCYADISDVQGKKEIKAQIQILTLQKITPEIFRKDGALIYRAALATKRYMDGKCEESELY